MKFDELAVGDWFRDAAGEHYFEDAIFLKLEDGKAIAINWNESIQSFCHEDFDGNELELAFVPSFVCQHNFFEYHLPEDRRAFDFNNYHYNSFVVNNYEEVPYFAIFTYDYSIYYKKIFSDEAVIVHDSNNSLMGSYIAIEQNSDMFNKKCIVCSEIKFDFPEISP